MVGHRAKRLIQRNRELLAQMTRMRLEAKEQAREERCSGRRLRQRELQTDP
jgi:hypothetical protein